MTCWLCGFETTELATNPKARTCQNGPCQICTAIANVDEEINQSASRLQRLLVKRCDLRSEQNRLYGTLIHRFPTELQNYIFQLFRPLRDEWGGFPRFQRPNIVTPLYLASICRSWRDIAWSNPLLWSTIHISIGIQVPQYPSRRIKYVQDWVQRSQTSPLTLHIEVYEEGLEEESKALIDVISQCSNRWHSLSLDMPLGLFRAFQLTDFQCHLRLRIDGPNSMSDDSMQCMPLLNPTASPEKIELHRISFQSLQISWNHLSFATVEYFDLEEITQLFQHASQMTVCQIVSPRPAAPHFSMSPIRNQRLKTLGLYCALYMSVAPTLLGSLTLPCLQEFRMNEMTLLTPAYLPALLHRSSCPLTSITITDNIHRVESRDHDLQPVPGVSELVVEIDYDAMIPKILLEGYFPDLRHLTFRLNPFLNLWTMGVIPLLLDQNSPRPDGPNARRVDKILVVDVPARFDDIWNSEFGEQLKALNISLREDGFEFL